MWVYVLTLSEQKSAGDIESDWTASHPGTAEFGVTQVNGDAVIVTTPRDPNFADFTSEVGYVDSIEEYMELPAPGGSNWTPPYQAHPNGTIEFQQ